MSAAEGDLRFVEIDASNFDDIPAPLLPGASCRSCDYWETLDGSRTRAAGEAAHAAKLRRLTATARLGGSNAMLAYRTDVDGAHAAIGYAQFGAISAYPRAQAIRDRYPVLPDSPPPYVITCLQVRDGGERDAIAEALLRAVCDALDRRGVVAVEAYPEGVSDAWLASSGPPSVYQAAGFERAAGDDRYPVYRIELAGETEDVAWPAELLRTRNPNADEWPLPVPRAPATDEWPIPPKPRVRNPFGED